MYLCGFLGCTLWFLLALSCWPPLSPLATPSALGGLYIYPLFPLLFPHLLLRSLLFLLPFLFLLPPSAPGPCYRTTLYRWLFLGTRSFAFFPFRVVLSGLSSGLNGRLNFPLLFYCWLVLFFLRCCNKVVLLRFYYR